MSSSLDHEADTGSTVAYAVGRSVEAIRRSRFSPVIEVVGVEKGNDLIERGEHGQGPLNPVGQFLPSGGIELSV